ncbi:hypothetical protein H072_838 [Dactylellina haptotyla CBS 200.50]|uniref:CHAT domain-containing protein n=1 Tax=Dactylellina haptotyla (strain CBS 200.50) TaxID=1284197 RepID=S8C089_DACHA|nr:hypothetical protein H072_838 [Dactylellina haptotyla CBS 200.50]
MARNSAGSYIYELDLAYYDKVDRTKLGQFQNLEISELHRLSTTTISKATPTTYIHYALFLKTGAIKDLERAIQENGPVDGNPNYASRLKDLISMLSEKYQRTGSLEDLESAIFRAQEMVAATSQSHPERPARIKDWITLMMAKFKHTNEEDDLSDMKFLAEQIGCSIKLVKSRNGISIEVSLPRSEPNTPTPVATRPSPSVATRPSQIVAAPRPGSNTPAFNVESILAALQQGMMSQETQIQSGGMPSIMNTASNPDALRLGMAASRHGFDFENTGSTASLQLAIEYGEQAVAASSARDYSRPNYVGNLGYLLLRRYELSGERIDIERSIKFCSEAVGLVPLSDPERPMMLRSLGYAYGTKYMLDAEMGALDKAIRYCQEAVDTAAPGDQSVADWMSSLSIWLFRRFQAIGIMEDLEQSIKLNERAIEMPAKLTADLAGRLGNLVNGYEARYRRTRNIEDLKRTIKTAQRAIINYPANHPNRPGSLIQLSNSLSERFKLWRREEDINRVVRILDGVLARLPHNHPGRPGWLVNLGLGLSDRFKTTGDKADLFRAVQVTDEGLDAMPVDHKDRGRALNMLCNRLIERALSTGWSHDMDQAVEKCRDGLDSMNLEPSRRLALGFTISKIFIFQFKWEEASKYMELAIEALPLVTSRAAANLDKQLMLEDYSGHASIAAATALNAGKTAEHALRILEIGREVISGLLMDLRGDITELEQHYPGLAKSFVTLRDRLDTPSNGPLDDTSESSAPARTPNVTDRLKAERELDQLLITIRHQPGFENFFLPPTADEMKAAAESGPIIVINVCNIRCDAIIVERDKIRVVKLPKLTDTEAASQARKLQSATQGNSSEMANILRWLWDSIGEETMSALGFKQEVLDGNWPHVWWVLTGILSQFPIHAAGLHEEGSTESVMDRVISSYASSVKTLIHGRRQRTHSTAPAPNRAVLVCMDKTEGLGANGRLPFAKKEIEILTGLCPQLSMEPVTPVCIKKDVLKSLETCKIFHFAGHGHSHPTEPSRSALLLHDWMRSPLTVADLQDAKFRKSKVKASLPFLGYLSACSTKVNKSAKLADEGIHLVNALQLAGFQHVVGTLWEVSDSRCVDIARIFYENLREGMTDEAVRRGLHLAIRTVRDEEIDGDNYFQSRNGKSVNVGTGDFKFDWVPYVHFGL